MRHHLQGGLQEIERYTDKLGEICDCIADKYLRRLCRIMKRIESHHCHGFVPMDVMMESIDFVNRLVELLNNKSDRIGEFSDVSTIDPLLGEKCCTNFNADKNKDPECLDKNENILVRLMMEQMNPGRIDLRAVGNYSTTNEKYINRLINEHKTVTSILSLLEKKMEIVNSDTSKYIFNVLSNHKLDEKVVETVEFDKITLTTIPFDAIRNDFKILTGKTRESKTYKKIRNTMLDALKRTEIASSYIKNKVPIVCPCTFFKHERSVEKTLTSYIELFRFGKYMWSYIVLKGIAHELTDVSFAKSGCKSVKELFFKNSIKHHRCMDRKYKDRNVKYFFMNTLFQKYFADYIHDNELYDDVSATIAATAPVTAPTFTPAVIFSVKFGDLLQNEKFYTDLQMLFMIQNRPQNNSLLTIIIKQQLDSFIKVFNEYTAILTTIKIRFDSCEEYFGYIDENLLSYNDINESDDDRNSYLKIVKHSILQIKKNLDILKDSSQNDSIEKLLTKRQELSDHSVSFYLNAPATIYNVWVNKTYNNYHQMYQFFEAKYYEYDKIITPLKEI